MRVSVLGATALGAGLTFFGSIVCLHAMQHGSFGAAPDHTYDPVVFGGVRVGVEHVEGDPERSSDFRSGVEIALVLRSFGGPFTIEGLVPEQDARLEYWPTRDPESVRFSCERVSKDGREAVVLVAADLVPGARWAWLRGRLAVSMARSVERRIPVMLQPGSTFFGTFPIRVRDVSYRSGRTYVTLENTTAPFNKAIKSWSFVDDEGGLIVGKVARVQSRSEALHVAYLELEGRITDARFDLTCIDRRTELVPLDVHAPLESAPAIVNVARVHGVSVEPVGHVFTRDVSQNFTMFARPAGSRIAFQARLARGEIVAAVSRDGMVPESRISADRSTVLLTVDRPQYRTDGRNEHWVEETGAFLIEAMIDGERRTIPIDVKCRADVLPCETP